MVLKEIQNEQNHIENLNTRKFDHFYLILQIIIYLLQNLYSKNINYQARSEISAVYALFWLRQKIDLNEQGQSQLSSYFNFIMTNLSLFLQYKMRQKSMFIAFEKEKFEKKIQNHILTLIPFQILCVQKIFIQMKTKIY
ncbi:hypothetical protein ABPG72_015328 [Tetrahymena utriculariae]